ncbi:nuclear transport factor 2 family protein [Ichthyenterobacterium magnum]|uniref:SnoaL-like protein n=1 Tax=Ichthyenterobacterium magnum TaxID=1230530 RepID=A0A420DMC1_9FLAO|nr:nuclear transport factor 2 family protein [Ichthyenterobacterium magnum]RKE95327.1 hypothetical protein BXY80_1514 [Ichthyenterobacterium magnum]
MTAKEVARAFYDLDLVKDTNAISHFHPECELQWNSTKGFTTFNYKGIKNMLEGVQNSFLSFKYRLSHLLEDDNIITARYTIYVTAIETPDMEQPLAHFISIWHVKEGKLFKGFEISQQVDESVSSINSYSEIKV